MAVYASAKPGEIGPVAITIRNKETEDLIRRIGRRTGEEPDAVVLRLVKAEAGPAEAPPAVAPEEVARRKEFFDQLRKKYPPPDNPMTWAEIEEEMDSIFGDDLK
jgi:hypothetical protein